MCKILSVKPFFLCDPAQLQQIQCIITSFEPFDQILQYLQEYTHRSGYRENHIREVLLLHLSRVHSLLCRVLPFQSKSSLSFYPIVKMDAAPQVAVDPRRPKAAVPAPTPTPTPAEVVEVPPSTEEQDSSITTEPPTTSLPESDLSTPDVPTMASEAAPEADRAAMDAAIAATLGELTAISDDMGTAAPEEVEESTNDVAMDVGVEGSDVGVNNVVTALKAEDGNSTPMFSDVSSVDGDAPVAESETVVINPVSKGAAPLSRVAQLSARVEKNPWDGEARLALIGDAETKGDLEKTREAYENFLQFFPDAVSHFVFDIATFQTHDSNGIAFLRDTFPLCCCYRRAKETRGQERRREERSAASDQWN